MQEETYYSVRMRAYHDAPYETRRKTDHHLQRFTGRGEWLTT
ncbi:hypothetical protein [Bacillus sp. PK3-130]